MFVRMGDMTFLYGGAAEGPCPEPCEGLAPLGPPKWGPRPPEQAVRLASCPHQEGAPREHGLAMLGTPAYFLA